MSKKESNPQPGNFIKPYDFDSGARAMFDFFMQNACRFHANLALNTECRKENKLISELAEDALEEVSPETLKKWKDISKLQQEISTLKKKWQPIKSCPKDQTKILIKLKSGEIGVGWISDCLFVGDPYTRMTFNGTSKSLELWGSKFQPKEWMPIPE